MASEVGQEAARPGRAGKGLRREGGNESIAICASHCSGGGRPPARPPPRPAGLPELHAQGLAGTSGREQGGTIKEGRKVSEPRFTSCSLHGGYWERAVGGHWAPLAWV